MKVERGERAKENRAGKRRRREQKCGKEGRFLLLQAEQTKQLEASEDARASVCVRVRACLLDCLPACSILQVVA